VSIDPTPPVSVAPVPRATPARPPVPFRPPTGRDEATAQPTSQLLSEDLANFGLPLALTLAFGLFLVVEGRLVGYPTKLTEARVATRRPLPFR
jgi:hypothetical protein